MRSRGLLSGPLAKSALATGGLMMVIVFGAYLNGGSRLIPFLSSADSISDQDRQERLKAFNALGIAPLAPVQKKDLSAAMDGMQLDAQEKQALASDMAAASSTLAWMTLWDTNAEDGDGVRIDSGGYSRTIILKNQPVTFAIPVPANGIISITGTADGEGGGITVGLSSGGFRVPLPVMSVGQTLSIKVRADG